MPTNDCWQLPAWQRRLAEAGVIWKGQRLTEWHAKPRLRKVSGMWECQSLDFLGIGYGVTAASAYEYWRHGRLRDLELRWRPRRLAFNGIT